MIQEITSVNFFFKLIDCAGRVVQVGRLVDHDIKISGVEGIYVLDIPELKQQIKIIKE